MMRKHGNEANKKTLRGRIKAFHFFDVLMTLIIIRGKCGNINVGK
jgi:hypothetical protein